ncbi:MAG: CdaR family protein, partial [Chloroflexota bacterium]
MANRLVRSIWKNLGTVLLSFTLAIAVWISAVVAGDQNEECIQPNVVSLEVRGQDEDLLIIGDLPDQVSVSLQAPSSICRELASQPGLVKAVIDLTDFKEGEYQLLIDLEIDTQPVRILEILPHNVDIFLEEQVRIDRVIKTVLTGEPARGFQAETTILDVANVIISGPVSLLEQVAEVRVEIDITGARESISIPVTLVGVDENGQEISGLTFEPEIVQVNQPIVQAGGFRTVAVRVETVGQPESGYRLTTIQVSPPTITISSSDPQQVEALPGFVSTLPLDLSNLTDNEEVRLSLVLPPGVFVEGEQTVLVFVGITAIEGTTVMSIPVE